MYSSLYYHTIGTSLLFVHRRKQNYVTDGDLPVWLSPKIRTSSIRLFGQRRDEGLDTSVRDNLFFAIQFSRYATFSLINV